jgi:hypothetical protein
MSGQKSLGYITLLPTMDMISIHQVFEVRRQSSDKPKGKRDQNNEGEEATISLLGCPCGFWERVGQVLSILK